MAEGITWTQLGDTAVLVKNSHSRLRQEETYDLGITCGKVSELDTYTMAFSRQLEANQYRKVTARWLFFCIKTLKFVANNN